MKLTGNSIRTLVTLSIGLSVLGCTATPPPPLSEEPISTEPVSQIPQDESFDPLSLEEEDIIVTPPSQLKAPSIESDAKTQEKSETSGGMKEIPGYRVQIFVTTEEFDARQVEEEALLNFDESVYLIFDSPNYKVRLGDCTTRANANQLRQKAVGLGYRDAWVVQSKVMVIDR